MKKKILYLFIILITGCNEKKENEIAAVKTEINFIKTFTGKIADKYPITMNLTSHNDTLGGNYVYDKSGIPINIRGQIKDDSIFIDGLDLKAKYIDKFKGVIKENSITGIWSDPRGNNQQKFFLKEKLKDSVIEDDALIGEEETVEKKYNDNDFPIIEFIDAGFYENIPEFKFEGASFKLIIKMKNNTPDIIRDFELKYYIKVVMKDSDFKYYPSGFVGGANTDDIKFNDDIMKYNIPYDSVWNPNEIKTIKLTVPGSKTGANYYNFSYKKFERTPLEAVIGYRYNATSVDGEYENTEFYNILEFWKEYQTEINLR